MEHPVFIEIFQKMPQGAPGDDASSQKAFSLLKELPSEPEILDAGCGTGRHTLLLSQMSQGKITALDLLDQNLEILKTEIDKNKLNERITPVKGDLTKMSFKREQFNLIWSEGSIYVVGFEKGLQDWKKFIKPDGYLVATEIVWIRDDPPSELKEFWDAEYPQMLTHTEALNIAKKEGYKTIDTLPVSDTGWKNYYTPLEARIKVMRKKYLQDEDAGPVLDLFDKEIEIYKKYKDYFEYMFYILQKKDDIYIRSICGVRRKIE
jgi:ubiquinone/menaquinone biosynthesis C-methylase UbiE